MSTRTTEARTIAGLSVTEWPGLTTTAPTVIALPGLTSTARAWIPMAEALPEQRVIGPDLRGRGGSAAVTGPPGLRHHAADVKAIADELDLDDVVLIGHSMGAFLAPLVAAQLGDRVRRVVLLDGGVPPKLPAILRPAIVRGMFRRNMRKADGPWTDADTFVRETAGDALIKRPDLAPAVLRMVEPDLAGHPGALRPRLDGNHAIGDAVDSFFGRDVKSALAHLNVPTTLLAAADGAKDGAKPFLSDAAIAEWTARLPNLAARRVDANHLTLLFSPEVPKAVAA